MIQLRMYYGDADTCGSLKRKAEVLKEPEPEPEPDPDPSGDEEAPEKEAEAVKTVECVRRGCSDVPCAEHPSLCKTHLDNKCSVPTCMAKKYGRGMCNFHAYGTCSVEGCTRKASHGSKCDLHSKGACKVDGCGKVVWKRGLCCAHTVKALDEAEALERETVDRIRRNKALRAKFLGPVLERQNNLCADPLGRCPWVRPLNANVHALPLPHDAAELDHRTPLSEGGKEDDPDNLQVLCGCCHAMKTHAERAV